jgi:adenosylmethionine-8-amino-7-oxononanoate aminotransferase
MSRSQVWHPFTQHALEPTIPEIVRTEGAYLHKADGTRILDAISSWWVVTHGHRHPRIIKAIETASTSLDQIIFAGFTHEPAERLAKALVGLAPPGLDWVFYSDSGSTSVEVALKMVLGYFRNIGAPRSRIVVMEHSYHGDTIGTMSVGARGVFNAAYEPLLFEVDTIPFPAAGREQETLDRFEAVSRDRHAAALIVEPLALGAGGMLMYPAWVLAELKKIAEASGTLLLADEVMTGWGRTGTLLACEQADVVPDILCLSKGLTGGAVPLAVTMASEPIFEAHWSTDRARMFFHSSSYTANPIACAAANANLAIWREESVIERIADLGQRQQRHLDRLAAHARCTAPRRLGTIAALDLGSAGEGYLAGIAPRLLAFFRERDVLLRPLGSTVYVMPPYAITPEQLDRVWQVIGEAFDRI